MLELVLGVGFVLILIAVILIFRIHTLIGVAKGVEKVRITSKSNKLNALFFVLFLIVGFTAFFWYSITRFNEYFIPIGSKHGVITDRLFWVTMAVTGVVFIITQILLFVFSYKYQYKKKAKALFFPENNKLEVIWTIVPGIALALLIFSGWKAWSDITDKAPKDAEVIEVMGQQFAWKLRYPGSDKKLGEYDFRLITSTNEYGLNIKDPKAFDDFMPPELHIPKNKPVLLKIRAKDVLHSVYAPHFRLKMDAVPGMPTSFWFVPNKTTEEMRLETSNPNFDYELACAEICGRGHFSMRIKVVVHEQEEYDAWYKSQKGWYETVALDSLKAIIDKKFTGIFTDSVPENSGLALYDPKHKIGVQLVTLIDEDLEHKVLNNELDKIDGVERLIVLQNYKILNDPNSIIEDLNNELEKNISDDISVQNQLEMDSVTNEEL